MFRHVVMFRWSEDGVSDETKTAIAAGLDKLAGLPMTLGYHHGPDAGVSDGNWDYVAVGDFATVEDYKAYAVEPGHVALITDLIKPNISARAAVQYDVG